MAKSESAGDSPCSEFRATETGSSSSGRLVRPRRRSAPGQERACLQESGWAHSLQSERNGRAVPVRHLTSASLSFQSRMWMIGSGRQSSLEIRLAQDWLDSVARDAHSAKWLSRKCSLFVSPFIRAVIMRRGSWDSARRLCSLEPSAAVARKDSSLVPSCAQ